MAVSASALATAIIAEFPVSWNWSPGNANRLWLDALCQGFVSMWTAGVATPGTGPPPAGSYPHTHSITTLAAATMAAPAKLLGYTAAADAFVDVVSAQVSSHLLSNTAMDTQQGETTHKHGYTSFGSWSALKSAIITATPLFGVGIAPWAEAFAKGLLNHLTTAADMTTSTGAGHLHTLS